MVAQVSVVSRVPQGLLFVVMAVVAIFCGLIIGLGENLPIVFALGLIVGALLMTVRTELMVSMTLFFTFVIQGTVQFYGKTGVLTWASFGLSALILVKIISVLIGRAPLARGQSDASVKSITLFLAAYVGFFLISFLINLPTLSQSLSAIKNTLPALGILLAIGWGNWKERSVTQLWWLIVAVALIQLPPVIHQHFFVAASRVEQGWDSVVGTMGGSQEGGGLNAMLVIVAIASMIFVLARYKRNALRLGPVMVVVFSSTAVILLGEVKAVFIWLPVALVLLYWRSIAKNPARAIVALFGIGIFLSIVFSAYQALYWEKQKLGNKSFSERIEKIGGYFFDADQMNYQTGEVSRIASLALWIGDPKSTPVTRVFGYGPGASKSVSVLGQGEVARRYAPLSIDSTTIATMLWDIGTLGFLAYAGFLVMPIAIATTLLKRQQLSAHAAAEIETAAITLVLLASLLIYNRTLVDQIVTQALTFLSIGTIVFHARRTGETGQQPAGNCK